jgi:hypothetical protein
MQTRKRPARNWIFFVTSGGLQAEHGAHYGTNLRSTAAALGVELKYLNAINADEIEALFAEISKQNWIIIRRARPLLHKPV